MKATSATYKPIVSAAAASNGGHAHEDAPEEHAASTDGRSSPSGKAVAAATAAAAGGASRTSAVAPGSFLGLLLSARDKATGEAALSDVQVRRRQHPWMRHFVQKCYGLFACVTLCIHVVHVIALIKVLSTSSCWLG